jgi:electron transfer flavoprotein alpha subunit
VAVVVCRDGRLPAGADEAVAEAEGEVLLVGTGAEEAAGGLPSATRVWWAEGEGGPAARCGPLARLLGDVTAVVMPASPDGRDLAPRVAAVLDRPLLAGAVAISTGDPDGTVRADLLRADGRVVIPVHVSGPAVATLLPGSRGPARAAGRIAVEIPTLDAASGGPDAELVAVVPPDPATMDLAEAPRVLGGGAGLVPRGAGDQPARAAFTLLGDVAAALGASAGATRVVTDAGWMSYDRQIGTTGVAIDPDLYVAFGVSGASQHVGGLGNPRHTVSVNTDPACPMTAMAALGLVTDATGLLLELAARLGIDVPPELEPWSVKSG